MQIGSRISPVNRLQRCSASFCDYKRFRRRNYTVSSSKSEPSKPSYAGSKTRVELSDGDTLIKTSMSVTNNAYQHVLSTGLTFKMPILRHLKSLSCAWLSTLSKASSFNGWPYILGAPTQAHNAVFKLYGNRPKWKHRYFNIPAATFSIMCKINMP